MKFFALIGFLIGGFAILWGFMKIADTFVRGLKLNDSDAKTEKEKNTDEA